MTVTHPVSFQHLTQGFKQFAGQSPYAVMLGGGEAPTALNQAVWIGLLPKRALRLYQGQLTQTSFGTGEPVLASKQSISPKEASVLFDLLKAFEAGKSTDQPLFTYLGYGFYRYCDAYWACDKWSNDGNLFSQDIQKTIDSPQADLMLIEFSDWIGFDLTTQTVSYFVDCTERQQYYESVLRDTKSDQKAAFLSEPPPNLATLHDYAESFEASLSQADFETAVSTLKQSIEAGDIYQANLSLALKKEIALSPNISPVDLYQRLCRVNPSPYSACLKLPEGWLISNSPELLLKRDQRQLVTRPIAGTRGRGQTLAEDKRLGDALNTSEKEQAEHWMLVDLLRNDLGRVCEAGSVKVPELAVLERYSHVTHIVSQVEGLLKPDLGDWEALASVFPGGTITGCPKLRCLEILEKTEPVERGFYTGSLGVLGKEASVLNILIRSVFLSSVTVLPDTQDSQALLRYNAALSVGAGIVLDSVPAYEYQECFKKAQALLGALYVSEYCSNPGYCDSISR